MRSTVSRGIGITILSLRTRDTVAVETPDRFATSISVTDKNWSSSGLLCHEETYAVTQGRGRESFGGYCPPEPVAGTGFPCSCIMRFMAASFVCLPCSSCLACSSLEGPPQPVRVKSEPKITRTQAMHDPK